MESQKTNNTKQEELAIKVSNISKSFKLPHEKVSSVKSLIVKPFTKRIYEKQQVLKDISFEVKKGDFFGIVGRNGSGKSTLLKLIAGIYAPDEGQITVNGKLVPFIELGVGFNPELTGRENVFLNGALLGFNRKEMNALYDEIVEFAELERFMDQKLKNYSSGMQVRLAFSIAIRAQADVLILDEVLAVGDEAFQRKCYAYFAKLKRDKKTVILVTHSMDSVQQFCTRALLLDSGRIAEAGKPARVAGVYLELNNQGAARQEQPDEEPSIKSDISAKVKLNKNPESLIFQIDIMSKKMIDDAIVTFAINRDSGEMVYRWSTDQETGKGLKIESRNPFRVTIEIQNIFPDGEYDIQLAVKKADRSSVYAMFNRILLYRLVNRERLKRNSHWKPQESIKYE